MKRETVEYTIRSPKIRNPLDLAMVSDLHDGAFDDLLPTLRRCDAILIVGDLVNRHSGGFERGAAFLAKAPDCAPTFYAIGNHERKLKRLAEYWPLVEQSRARVLDGEWVRFGGIVLGGLSSARKGEAVAAGVVDAMAQEQGFKLLMCHHPEYYEKYVQGKGIDLTLAGHAHGGQIRIAGHGLYAPGQGILPKLTSGWYDDGHLLVGRGLTNSAHAPRLGNPCELILLHLRPEASK